MDFDSLFRFFQLWEPLEPDFRHQFWKYLICWDDHHFHCEIYSSTVGRYFEDVSFLDDPTLEDQICSLRYPLRLKRDCSDLLLWFRVGKCSDANFVPSLVSMWLSDRAIFFTVDHPFLCQRTPTFPIVSSFNVFTAPFRRNPLYSFV